MIFLLKLCYLDVSGINGKFLFPSINSSMLNEILVYKSWELFDSWSGSSEKINYLDFTNTRKGVLVETKDGIGFVSVLLNHLNKLGFTIKGIDGKPFNQYDKCIKVKFPMFKFNLRNYQLNSCLKWTRDRMGVIKAPTGSGKTIMASYLMKNVGYKTLILVHTLDLVSMWKHSLDKTFGLSFGDTIGIFGGGKQLSKVINKNVIIGTYQSALKEENMNILKNAGFGFACLDEVHHVACDTFKSVVNNLFVPCKLGLSATPRRLDGKDDEIFALVDSVKASVSIHSLIRDRFVVRPDFYNISWIDNQILVEVDKEQKGLAKSRKLKQLSAFSVNKYTLLLKLVERFRRENKTFLLFADYVKAAEAIEEIINEFITVNDKNFRIVRVTQKMSSDDRSSIFNSVGKKHNDYNGLIFAKLGSEGIDIAAVDCVINLSPSKSPVTFAQRTGRAMRQAKYKDHCEIYQFVLKSSMEEGWAEFSFDEYRQEQFVAKNYVIR